MYSLLLRMACHEGVGASGLKSDEGYGTLAVRKKKEISALVDEKARHAGQSYSIVHIYIKTKESRGYIGPCIKQLEVRPPISYDVKMYYFKALADHIIECYCKYFHDHRSYCQHIALALANYFLYIFFVAFHPGMVEPYVRGDPATAVVPEVDLPDIYLQHLGQFARGVLRINY